MAGVQYVLTWTAILVSLALYCCDEMSLDEFNLHDDGDFDDNSVVTSLMTPSMPFGMVPIELPADGFHMQGQSKPSYISPNPGPSQTHSTGVCHHLPTGGYHSFPGSCNQYIHCDKEQQGFIETCAVGTFFDGKKCARAEDVDCHYDPCKQLTTGHQYTDGQTCYGHYSCVKGKSMSGRCPNGFAFNTFKQGCLPDPTCSQHTGIMHHPNATKHTCACFAGTTLAFPGKPHKFYLWDGKDSVTPMRCPSGLWYNPSICTCDWIIPGVLFPGEGCHPMFHFGYNGHFLEEYNKVPQAPNTAVSIFKKSALFSKGGRIIIWMMDDIDLDSEWSLCFEFMTEAFNGEVALVSNDWKGHSFTYKITYIPTKHVVMGYFRMKDGTVAELVIMGVEAGLPHFVRVAKLGAIMKMRVDNMIPATVKIEAGVMSAPSPMVIGSAADCTGFIGFFDELKFFRCVPNSFFGDYKGLH